MYRAVLERADPSMVHSESISKRYRDVRVSASAVGILFPVYSRMNAPALIFPFAKSPCPSPGRDVRTKNIAPVGSFLIRKRAEYSTAMRPGHYGVRDEYLGDTLAALE